METLICGVTFEFHSVAVLFSVLPEIGAVALGLLRTSGLLPRSLSASDTCQEMCFHEWITSVYFCSHYFYSSRVFFRVLKRIC